MVSTGSFKGFNSFTKYINFLHRFQKNAARLTQEFTARANEVIIQEHKQVPRHFHCLVCSLILFFNFICIGCRGYSFTDENCPNLWNSMDGIWKAINLYSYSFSRIFVLFHTQAVPPHCAELIRLFLSCGCRYKSWLERLASISFRQSAAYGVWTWSFVILYRSTQVCHALYITVQYSIYCC